MFTVASENHFFFLLKHNLPNNCGEYTQKVNWVNIVWEWLNVSPYAQRTTLLSNKFRVSMKEWSCLTVLNVHKQKKSLFIQTRWCVVVVVVFVKQLTTHMAIHSIIIIHLLCSLIFAHSFRSISLFYLSEHFETWETVRIWIFDWVFSFFAGKSLLSLLK